jgi:hypothetical protein
LVFILFRPILLSFFGCKIFPKFILKPFFAIFNRFQILLFNQSGISPDNLPLLEVLITFPMSDLSYNSDNI